MSFDKHYPKRKDRRKPYYGSKKVDKSCRPGGDCPFCTDNRQYKRKLEELDEIEFEENNGTIQDRESSDS